MSFFNLYHHNFVRLAVAVPEVRVADPAFNGDRTIELMHQADARRCALVVFPELGLSAYSCEDLFHQQALLDGALAALENSPSAIRTRPVGPVWRGPLRVSTVFDGLGVTRFDGA